MNDTLVWFLVVVIHGASCPVAKCEASPAITIQMPSEEVCEQAKKDNSGLPLECWGKRKP